MITDVGIDMDGVMYDFAGVFHEYAQNRMNKELPAPVEWDFYKAWGLSDQEFTSWLNDGVRLLRLFDCAPPIPLVIDGWNHLKEQGIKIHILTHRGNIAYEQTVQWLYKYGLYPDTLHFGTHKTIIKQIATDEAAAIDDYLGYYNEYEQANIYAFLQTQPWNAHAESKRRVTDLLNFSETIRVINDYSQINRKKQQPLKQYKNYTQKVQDPSWKAWYTND